MNLTKKEKNLRANLLRRAQINSKTDEMRSSQMKLETHIEPKNVKI